MIDHRLHFDPTTHTYTWDGQVAPSVTQALREWVKTPVGLVNIFSGIIISEEVMQAAADFGSAVHLGCRYILTDGLDGDALDPALVPPLQQFEKWLDDYKIKPLLVEEPMYSKKHGYAGTPDIICKSGRLPLLIVCDIKTAMSALVGPQLAGYQQLYVENAKYRGKVARYALHLPKEGSQYKFIPQERRDDWSFFQCKLYEHKWRAAA